MNTKDEHLLRSLQLRQTGGHTRAVRITSLTAKIRKKLQDAPRGVALLTRNGKCPCGSGRRFKRCCLANCQRREAA
jgi:uncharacterized protein YecA (UPF0149 family)